MPLRHQEALIGCSLVLDGDRKERALAAERRINAPPFGTDPAKFASRFTVMRVVFQVHLPNPIGRFLGTPKVLATNTLRIRSRWLQALFQHNRIRRGQLAAPQPFDGERPERLLVPAVEKVKMTDRPFAD
jgi:hypothetical protein